MGMDVNLSCCLRIENALLDIILCLAYNGLNIDVNIVTQ